MEPNRLFYHLLAGCGGHENVLCRPPTTESGIDQRPQLLCWQIHPCTSTKARLLPGSDCVYRGPEAGMGHVRLSWPTVALDLLDGLADPSLDCMAFQDTATYPSFPLFFTHDQLCQTSSLCSPHRHFS